ncbi:MAG: hypothetical protein ONB23_08355 [candidate division KSB1 bacterium]|nr:hypothetical protein [candidate division KSB1 bacterium]
MGIVTGLTLLFTADDWLLIFLARELQLEGFSDPFLAAAAALLTVANALLAVAIFRLMRKKPMCGAEGLVGETGRALESFSGTGRVAVHGEIWRARALAHVTKGQKVRVLSVRGLEVDVRPLSSEEAAGAST